MPELDSMPTLILPGAWQACVDAFLRSVEERSGSLKSREKYQDILRLFFRDPEKSPGAYTRADVQAFLDHGSFGRWNAGAPVSVSTRNGRLSALRSFYIFAATYEPGGASLLPGAAPVRGFRYLKPSVRYRALSASELERFFAVIPDTLAGARDRALFLVYFWTARRHAEIARLCWRDIEPATIIDSDEAAHEGHIYRYIGKGHAREIKTKELPAPAYSAIVAFLTRAKRLDTIQPQEPIFCSVYPGRGRARRDRVPLAPSHICARFKCYIKAAGLDDSRKLTIHSLRHTASRERYSVGEDVVAIQNLLDHSSLQTTSIYLQNLTVVADKWVSRLEGKFARLSTP